MRRSLAYNWSQYLNKRANVTKGGRAMNSNKERNTSRDPRDSRITGSQRQNEIHLGETRGMCLEEILDSWNSIVGGNLRTNRTRKTRSVYVLGCLGGSGKSMEAEHFLLPIKKAQDKSVLITPSLLYFTVLCALHRQPIERKSNGIKGTVG